jgi:hypothetical protein
MPTGMANAGKRVVLGVEIYTATIGGAGCGLERGAETVGVTSGRDSMSLEEVADGVVGKVFLVRQLRVSMNLFWS